MPRPASILIAIATLAAFMAAAVAAPDTSAPSPTSVPKKHHGSRRWHGYGFLPGYRPPEVIERERAKHFYETHGPQFYGPAWPGFYRGRWNGGGFGPCWTQTPIGPVWNCGR